MSQSYTNSTHKPHAQIETFQIFFSTWEQQNLSHSQWPVKCSSNSYRTTSLRSICMHCIQHLLTLLPNISAAHMGTNKTEVSTLHLDEPYPLKSQHYLASNYCTTTCTIKNACFSNFGPVAYQHVVGKICHISLPSHTLTSSEHRCTTSNESSHWTHFNSTNFFS